MYVQHKLHVIFNGIFVHFEQIKSLYLINLLLETTFVTFINNHKSWINYVKFLIRQFNKNI